MTITRYSALSVSISGGPGGLTLVGGAGCVTDETDSSTYIDWHPTGVDASAPKFRVEFGVLPGVDGNSRVVLHIVGGYQVSASFGTDGPGYVRFVPVDVVDSVGGGYGHVLGSYGSLVAEAQADITHTAFPFLPDQSALFAPFDFAGGIAVQSDALATAGSWWYGFKVYGMYLTVETGLETGAPLSGTPYVAVDFWDGGLVTLDSAGSPLLVTGNMNPVFGIQPITAWDDGSIGLPWQIKDMFGVLQPQGSEIYSVAQLTDTQANDFYDNGFEYSLLGLASSATVMVCWYSEVYEYDPVFVYTAQPVYWEIDKDGVVLNEWRPTIPVHSETGDLTDNAYPQTGGRFGDKFIFNTADNGTSDRNFTFLMGSGNHGGDVLSMDLVTGIVTTIITDADIGLYAGLPAGAPYYGNPYLGGVAVDPVNGDIYLYCADTGYDEVHDDAEMWISRWSIDGTFKGKVGFLAGGEWYTFGDAGGITCCDDGRLIFYYSGRSPDVAPYGNEYDGLLQIDKTVVPTDGSTVFVSPTPFWREIPDFGSGLPGDVTKMMSVAAPPPDPVVVESEKCVLGCGDTQAIITDARGGRQILDITPTFSRLDYGRVLDDTSQASTDVVIGGTADGDVCCEKLGDTRTWRHALTVYRDNDLVWGPGPITNLLYGRDTVKIIARDISAWLDKRKTRLSYTFEGISAVEIARTLIVDAMAPSDPAGLVDAMIIVTPATPHLYDVTVEANIYVGDALRELAKSILDFTVVGRSIIISEQLRYGPFARLTDEDFLADIEVEERGLEAGTDWTVVGATADVIGEAGGTDSYFGLLEGIIQDQDVTDPDYVLTEAQRALGVSNPPPVYINMPDDARLSPTAPVCLEQLVPGTLMDIDLRNVCRPISSRNRLTAVKVQLTGDDEQVGVTVSPAGPEFSTPESNVVRDLAPPDPPPPPPPAPPFGASLFWNLDEASGAVAFDSSGNGHDGTYYGTPGFTQPSLRVSGTGNSVQFSGDDRVEIAHAAWMDETTMSIAARVKTTATSVPIWDRDVYGSPGNRDRLWQSLINASGKFELFTFDGVGNVVATATSTTSVNDDVEHPVAATVDGTNIKLFVDGVLEATVAAPPLVYTAGCSTYLGLGVNRSAGGGSIYTQFIGQLDEAGYWAGTVLTPAQIAILAAQ